MTLLCMPYMRFLEEAANYPLGKQGAHRATSDPLTATDEAAQFYHYEFSSMYRRLRNMGIRESIAEDFKEVHGRYISESGKWIIRDML